MFQSTLPRGERLNRLLLIKTPISFNPHSHEGSDNIFSVISVILVVSIHTPTRGATDYVHTDNNFTQVSIHTPTRGATIDCTFISPVVSVSIHTPTRGATRGRGYAYYYIGVSIHTPTRGATYSNDARGGYHTFQSTLPRGERRSKTDSIRGI